MRSGYVDPVVEIWAEGNVSGQPDGHGHYITAGIGPIVESKPIRTPMLNMALLCIVVTVTHMTHG